MKAVAPPKPTARVGRPPIGDERMRMRSFPCDDERWDRAREAAQQSGKSLAEWLRDAIEAAADSAGV